jgi:hypothetical protein
MFKKWEEVNMADSGNSSCLSTYSSMDVSFLKVYLQYDFCYFYVFLFYKEEDISAMVKELKIETDENKISEICMILLKFCSLSLNLKKINIFNIKILEEYNYKFVLKTGILVPLYTIIANHAKAMAKVF